MHNQLSCWNGLGKLNGIHLKLMWTLVCLEKLFEVKLEKYNVQMIRESESLTPQAAHLQSPLNPVFRMLDLDIYTTP